jgi:peptidoglycan/LPS O-acetylase OafA/YrhL
MSGLDHGFFEALQGNASTHGVFVQAIGPAHRMWVYGTEDAFTVVPNFLISGILAIMVGALIVVWSVGFIDRKNGSRVFLGLGGLLFLVGGGVALVGFVALCWTVARRLGRTSTRSSAGPSGGVLGLIARMWAIFLAASVVLVAFALEIAISGFVPGVSNPDHVQLICWSSLAAMLFMLLLAILGGSLHDAQLRARAEMAPVPTR